MTWREIGILIQDILDHKLFEIAQTSVTPGKMLVFILVVFLSHWFSLTIQKAIKKAVDSKKVSLFQESRGFLRLVHYCIVLIGFVVALQIVGIDISILFAAGAVFAVGVGFAVQNVAQNFVSGVILLMERAIKPGDILMVEGTVVRVMEMGIRATIARTRDDEDLIIPNATLVQSTVTNFTLKDSRFRVRAVVGVSYSSNLGDVKAALKQAAKSVSGKQDFEWRILLTGFGDSTVNYELSIWIDDPWDAPAIRTSLFEAIWDAFKEKGVVIAFPQLDVHFDPPVSQAFSKTGTKRLDSGK